LADNIYPIFRPLLVIIATAIVAVVEKLKGLWTFIKDGLGITKGEKKEAFLKAAEGTGYKYVVGEKDKDEGTVYTGWKNEHGYKISASALPENIRRAYEAYQNAPGSVFEQVGDYLTGILTNVKELFDPVLNPLTDAINKLCDWLGIGDEEETPNAVPVDLTPPETFQPPVAPETPPTPPTFPSYAEQMAFHGPVEIGGGYSYNPATSAAEAIIGASPFSLSGHAEGVTFKSDGLYTGLFHGPEETLSRATTVKGPGIITRAMAALDVATKSFSGNKGSVGNTEIHIQNDNRFDFAGAKMDSSFDIRGFLMEVDKRIEAGSKKAVERAIGQGRT